MTDHKVKYLIIGNSAGGIGAAEAIREVDKRGSLAIVSDEPYPTYSRPLISDYLVERLPVERMLFRPAGFYEANNIQTWLDKKVVRLDLAARSIELESGQNIAWEKLLLATGGLPIVPPIKGLDQSGIFTFTTLNDARAIDRFLSGFPKRRARAVVIGGGLIGVSAAEALVKRGIEVIMVEMKDRILNTILDEETSALGANALSRAGVEIITGHTVAAINNYYSTGDVTSVTLDDGQPIPCELVIVAIGVQPRIELVSGTGIELNRGIAVDRYMAASQADVYACGDAAEAYDFVYDQCRLTPIWPNAYTGGRTAGFNMAGMPTEYPGGTAMNSMKCFRLNIVSAGMVNPPDGSYEILSQQHNGTYRKVILKDGLVAGMVFAGDIEKSGIVFSLMRDRINVENFKSALVAADFGLASLPRERWGLDMEVPAAEPASPVFSRSS